MINNSKVALVILMAPCCMALAGQGWWMTEPVSLIQTNLRETDANLDPDALIEQLKDFPANTLLFSVGGITAHYPTEVQFHYRSAYLPQGRDLAGQVIEKAHRNNIRVIARFDFSRARRAVYRAHPEWFYTRRDGTGVKDDNDLYSICINGDYYHVKAIEILTEALERYEVDGLFFNWFGNITSDYHGRYIGLCHCPTCQSRFRARYGRPIPDTGDAEYARFMHDSKTAVAKKFRDLIHARRPGALFMTYVDSYTDAITAESDYYKWRPLPQWIYAASEHVNRGRNTNPDKMVFNLVMPYQEMRYRFAGTAGTGLRPFLYQNMAHGAFPAFVCLGTMDQPDKTALHAVRPVFQYYDRCKTEYVGQRNAARVILCARQGPNWNRSNDDYRGFFRLLTELHIPFKVTDKTDDLSPDDIDLVIVPEGPTPQSLRPFLEDGGSALIAGTTHPGLGFRPAARLWEDAKATYMRIDDHTLFPSLAETWTLFWEGNYLELEPSPAPITLIPPSQFGPPDKVARIEDIKTDKPGLILRTVGQGNAAFIPWHIGALYYRLSNDKQRLLISDLIDHLLPNHQRQLTTDAHPSVEITLMDQPARHRMLLHLVNLSGHLGTAFFEAIQMRDIAVQLKGKFARAATLDGKRDLPTHVRGGYTHLTIPSLQEYQAICLYPEP
ncbi:MAG: family 10 glycosylhydrolase [Planctomycetota bacterium]|jgi:hypothetical protein